MNLTDVETFPQAPIKRAKTRVNKKLNFLHDTKRCIWLIAINNGAR